MKIFLTGITGLLGGHVAELCSKEGHEVLALVRNKKIEASKFPFKIKICHGDITDLNSIAKNLEGTEIIIHCAANTNMISLRIEQQEQTNIAGVGNLIVLGKKLDIRKFIHISTANTILPGNKNHFGVESEKLPSEKYRLPYINSKIKAEEILLNEFNANGFPVIILNPTFILGPNDLHLSSGKLVLSVLKEKVPFYPCGGKNIVDVRDVAKAIVYTIHNGKLGENYLLSNVNLSYKQLFDQICYYSNSKPPKYKLPKSIGLMMGYVGTFYEFFTNKSFNINHKTIQFSFENHYYSSDKAKKELNFTVRPVEETIKDTVNWFTNEY